MKLDTRNRDILRIAIPSIISNVTVPLLGMVDVAIVGHIGHSSYIGAIAVGTLAFNMIYWIFSFLRMGTSGLTAQAYGAGDSQEMFRILCRALLVGLSVACLLLLFQRPLLTLVFWLIDASEEVKELARTYYRICIWGAPAMLCLYGFTGWFLGMQNAKAPLVVAVTQNVVNIVGSLFFVFVCRLKIEGVALGTLIAQYCGIVLAACLWRYRYGRLWQVPRLSEVLQRDKLVRFFRVNRDIFLRTLCLIIVTLSFTSIGASQGDVVLAANTLLLQFFTIFSYVTDGFAFAGESLCGRFVGAGDEEAFSATVRRLFGWGLAGIVVFVAAYLAGGDWFLRQLTNDAEVLQAARQYFPWVLLLPVAGMVAFIWDGVFVGTTATREMFASILAATMVFFLLYKCVNFVGDNHALWLAFEAYLLTRGVVQTILYRKVKERSFV